MRGQSVGFAGALAWFGLLVSACGDDGAPPLNDEDSTTGELSSSDGSTSATTGDELDGDTGSSSGTTGAVLPEAVVWETELSVEDIGEAPRVYGVATSPSGRIYVVVSAGETRPVAHALDGDGEHRWSYELPRGEIEGMSLWATDHFLAVGQVMDDGSVLGGDYRVTVLAAGGDLASTVVGNTNDDDIGVAMLGDSVVVATAAEGVPVQGGTTSGVRIEAYRVGQSSPVWSWVRQGSISLPGQIAVSDDGSIFAVGVAGEPDSFATSDRWVARLSSGGALEWEHRPQWTGTPALTLAGDGTLHVTTGSLSYQLSPDGEAGDVLELAHTQGASAEFRPSWRGDRFLVGGRLDSGEAGVSAYDSAGASRWQYEVELFSRVYAGFIDDDTFVVAGTTEDGRALIHGVQIDLL